MTLDVLGFEAVIAHMQHTEIEIEAAGGLEGGQKRRAIEDQLAARPHLLAAAARRRPLPAGKHDLAGDLAEHQLGLAIDEGHALLGAAGGLDRVGRHIVPLGAENADQRLQRVEIAAHLLQGDQIEGGNDLRNIIEGLPQPRSMAEPVGVEIAQVPARDQKRVAPGAFRDLGAQLFAQRQQPFGRADLFRGVHPPPDRKI